MSLIPKVKVTWLVIHKKHLCSAMLISAILTFAFVSPNTTHDFIYMLKNISIAELITPLAVHVVVVSN